MLRFDPVQSRYIRSNPLHPTQELINEDDGYTVIRIYVIPSDELKMQILSYGPKVEVISPEWLRLETAQMLKRAAQQYR
jgi:predicted DNA-binding transcriptional regulator YafY